MSAAKQPMSDIEKQASSVYSSQETDNGKATIEPSTPIGIQAATLAPLQQSETAISSRSARAALCALDNFDTSPENPRNWTSRRKWRVTWTVAVSGFIATVGSSIAVPGIQPAMKEFGETNEKIGVLVASCYVFGMG